MVSINYAFKEISCKIVYYGPGLSGKTTNLQYVHKKVPQPTKGNLISLATDADRTLYFDFLPINIGSVAGFTTKFQLYTVPGQVYYNATRKLVLRGVDGLVFVADSQESKMEENVESLKNLLDNLQEYGYDLREVPMVIQYNKRDLPGALPLEVLERALNPNGFPSFEAVAVKGEGVFDTLKCIIKIVLEKARAKSESPVRVEAAPAGPPVLPNPPPAPAMEVLPPLPKRPEPVPAEKPAWVPEAAAPVLHRPVVVPGVRQTSGAEVERNFSRRAERPEPLSERERRAVTRPDFSLKNRPVLRPSELVKSNEEKRPRKKSFFSALFGFLNKKK